MLCVWVRVCACVWMCVLGCVCAVCAACGVWYGACVCVLCVCVRVLGLVTLSITHPSNAPLLVQS